MFKKKKRHHKMLCYQSQRRHKSVKHYFIAKTNRFVFLGLVLVLCGFFETLELYLLIHLEYQCFDFAQGI